MLEPMVNLRSRKVVRGVRDNWHLPVAQQDKRFRKACALFEMKLANKELDYDYLDSWDDKCFFDGDEDPDYFHDRDDVEFGSDEDDYQSLAQDLSLV